MISLENVVLLEQKVESAVAKIQQLQAENDALRSKCSELTNALSAKSEQLDTFALDQNRIESGILKALNRLNSIENTVLNAASQAASAPAAAKPQAPVQPSPAPQAAPVQTQAAPQTVTAQAVSQAAPVPPQPEYPPVIETPAEPIIPNEIEIPVNPASQPVPVSPVTENSDTALDMFFDAGDEEEVPEEQESAFDFFDQEIDQSMPQTESDMDFGPSDPEPKTNPGFDIF